MTWSEWATKHATLFGLSSDADLAMLREFAGLFSEHGYTADDLATASRDVAIRNPPRFRTEHLAALLAALQARRAREATSGPAEGEIGPPGASCAICGGAGILSDLPNPDSIARGKWTTCAALCGCAVGRWVQRNQGDRPLQTFDDYQTLLPDWQDRQEQRRRQRQAWNRARAAADELDRLMGQVLAKVRSRGE